MTPSLLHVSLALLSVALFAADVRSDSHLSGRCPSSLEVRCEAGWKSTVNKAYIFCEAAAGSTRNYGVLYAECNQCTPGGTGPLRPDSRNVNVSYDERLCQRGDVFTNLNSDFAMKIYCAPVLEAEDDVAQVLSDVESGANRPNVTVASGSLQCDFVEHEAIGPSANGLRFDNDTVSMAFRQKSKQFHSTPGDNTVDCWQTTNGSVVACTDGITKEQLRASGLANRTLTFLRHVCGNWNCSLMNGTEIFMGRPNLEFILRKFEDDPAGGVARASFIDRLSCEPLVNTSQDFYCRTVHHCSDCVSLTDIMAVNTPVSADRLVARGDYLLDTSMCFVVNGTYTAGEYTFGNTSIPEYNSTHPNLYCHRYQYYRAPVVQYGIPPLNFVGGEDASIPSPAAFPCPYVGMVMMAAIAQMLHVLLL